MRIATKCPRVVLSDPRFQTCTRYADCKSCHQRSGEYRERHLRRFAPARSPLSTLIPRSGAFAASRRMKAAVGATWFERALTRLLTMRLLDPGGFDGHATPFFKRAHRAGSLDGPRGGSVYESHEHRRPPLSSLVAHLLKRWPVRFIQTFIVLGPPLQAVAMCPVWRSLGNSRKRNT